MREKFSRPQVSTLIELLQLRARSLPDRRAYTFLPDGEKKEMRLTYAELDHKARSVAVQLRQLTTKGDRVVLLFQPGLDFIIALFGCIYAGTIAVPVYPLQSGRLSRGLLQLRAVQQDARPTAMLTSARNFSLLKELSENAPELRDMHWLDIENQSGSAVAVADWHDPMATGESVALLQYTSGSTSSPKGVMVSHANILHNSAVIHERFGHTPESRGVIWLPPYHDMGLIGGVLQPLYGGFPVTLLPPAAFLVRPLKWLQAISLTQATTSGGPNFAYDLCARKITAEQRATLDLSSWEVAFVGAEPVQRGTLERFAAAFESCGFSRKAFYPCYGLAEATLFVSGGRKGSSRTVRGSEGGIANEGRSAGPSVQEMSGQSVVGCGQVAADHKVIVVDPETRTQSSPGQVGEIWISGPSVTLGYWAREEETGEAFQAHLEDTGEGPFLRTGDLGFFSNDELFVSGRIKDLIIVAGRNHYPQDIERTAEMSHPALRPGCCAVFCFEVMGEERHVIAAEIDRRLSRGQIAENGNENFGKDRDSLNSREIARAIVQSVAEHHELRIDNVLLLRAGSLPKTTSGKVQRYRCRDRYLEGSLEMICEVAA